MLEDEVLKTITKYDLIQAGDKIVLGVSGGPDSICMLTCLNKLKEQLKFEIVVAHINHGIRENAKIDEKYVLEFCDKLGIECFVLHADVKQFSAENKMGLEEAGRKVRYDYFSKIMNETGANKIAIAHNSNDNVETIILNVLRGSGPSGLKGILPKNGIYIRPLIEVKRDLIEEYTKNLNPRHDESNDENEFSRNKIRNIVIPFIKEEFNPNIVDTITRLSSLVSEESEYLDLLTKKIYGELVIEEKNLNNIVYESQKDRILNSEELPTIILDLKKFNKENRVIQKRIILNSINKIFGSTRGIEKIHIDDILKMCNKAEGNKYLTPNKNTKILIKNNKIVIMRFGIITRKKCCNFKYYSYISF